MSGKIVVVKYPAMAMAATSAAKTNV